MAKVVLIGFFVFQAIFSFCIRSAAQENDQIAAPSALSSFVGSSPQKATPSQPHAIENTITIASDDRDGLAVAPQLQLPTVPIPLTNATSYIMDGAAVGISPGQETIYNMRIKSNQTSLADYLRIAYSFNLADQRFKPTQIVKFVNIGTCNPPYFVTNVPPNITMTYGSNKLSMGKNYSMTTTTSSVFTMNLVAADVISFLFENQTDDYRFTVVDPYGEAVIDETFQENTGVITQPIPILANGQYKIMVRPLNSSSLSFSMTFLNANRQALQSLSNGSYINDSFYSDLQDYAKYAIKLAKGKVLGITQPSDSHIQFTLMNSNGGIVAAPTGLPLLYVTPTSGTYYLFIDNNYGWGGTYSGTVTIN
jgi:hypothetical protein